MLLEIVRYTDPEISKNEGGAKGIKASCAVHGQGLRNAQI